MALTDYFPPGRLDSPATAEDVTHLEERLGTPLPADLRAFWATSATFNGNILLDDGTDGPYLRILHPASVLRPRAGGVVVVANGEDWDFGFVPGSPTRWVDVDREDGAILSDLADSFTGFLDALRAEHVAENDGLL